VLVTGMQPYELFLLLVIFVFSLFVLEYQFGNTGKTKTFCFIYHAVDVDRTICPLPEIKLFFCGVGCYPFLLCFSASNCLAIFGFRDGFVFCLIVPAHHVEITYRLYFPGFFHCIFCGIFTHFISKVSCGFTKERFLKELN